MPPQCTRNPVIIIIHVVGATQPKPRKRKSGVWCGTRGAIGYYPTAEHAAKAVAQAGQYGR